MDAVHLMRAFTGRDRILKVEGCYHGHHDSVMVSVLPEVGDEIGPDDAPIGIPDNTGIPAAIAGLIIVVRFNDLAAVEAALTRYPGEIAGMILEPIMMNAGIIYPERRLSRRPQGPAPRPRRAADLRRGEDRAHRRPRWRLRAVRRRPPT